MEDLGDLRWNRTPSHIPAWFIAIALALAPLEGTWLYLQHHWEEIPIRFSTHWNMNGVANGWSARSQRTVALPLLIGASIIALTFVTAAFTRIARADDRQTSARIMFPILTVISWSLSILFCWLALMPLGHSFGPTGFKGLAALQILVVIGAFVWTTWRIRQSPGTGTHNSTPDAIWRAGLFYYNPSDPSVFVPRRFSWGWTLNFARPAAWWYLIVVLLLALVCSLLPILLK